MMTLITNPAFWASVGALLSAIGLEMIPAQQLAEHLVAAIAGISGIVGIIHSMRASRQPQPAKNEGEALEQALLKEQAVTKEK